MFTRSDLRSDERDLAMTKTYAFQDPKSKKDVLIQVTRVGNEVNVDWTGHEPSHEAKEEAKRRFKEEFREEAQP